MEVTLASQLKAARIERGLSLADAAHQTRIPVPRLQQLEANNLAAFGNMAYARSFIRHYSEFLGVDATKFVKELPEPIFGGPQDHRYLTDSYGPWIDHRVRSSSHGQRDPSSASARSVYALVLLVVLGICSAVLANNFLFPPSTGAVEAKGPVSTAQPTTTPAKAKVASSLPAAMPKMSKFVSFAPQPTDEDLPLNASSLREKRAEPVKEDNQSPSNAQ